MIPQMTPITVHFPIIDLRKANELLWLCNPRRDGERGEHVGTKLVRECVLVFGKRG